MATTNPLNWNVPIVNPDRTPTHEFMQKWVLQARINGAIPTLSTAPEVSAVLDVLGSARGDILRRGLSTWGVLPSPSDPTKFLSGALDPAWGFVHDSDLALTDITANDVSIAAHGFAPKAPNDATKYLDGTGNYTVPAGGGGAAADKMLIVPSQDFATASSNLGGDAFTARVYMPQTAITLTGIRFYVKSGVGAGHTIYPAVYSAAGTALVGGALLGQGTAVALTAGLMSVPFNSPVVMPALAIVFGGFTLLGAGNITLAALPLSEAAAFFTQSTGTMPATAPAGGTGSGNSVSWWFY